MTVEAWRKQSKGKRASQIVAFTNSGQLAAMLAASARAHTDLEEVGVCRHLGHASSAVRVRPNRDYDGPNRQREKHRHEVERDYE